MRSTYVDKKLATELFSQNKTDATVLAFSLNCIWHCLEYWLDVLLPIRTYWSSHFLRSRENQIMAVTFRNSKKAKLHLSIHKAQLYIRILLLCSARKYIPQINTTSLLTHGISKKKKVCFKLVFVFFFRILSPEITILNSYWSE